MANSQYIVTIIKKDLSYRFKITYRKGLFLRFERDLAELKKLNIWNNIMILVPRYEKEIDELKKKKYQTVVVTYEKVIKQRKLTLYSACMGAYKDFYEQQTEIEPIINNVSGASLKAIISNLKKLTATDQEVIDTWRFIFSSWNKLEPFYRNQLELKQINSNLNTILRQVKHGQNHKKGAATSAANAARESI